MKSAADLSNVEHTGVELKKHTSGDGFVVGIFQIPNPCSIVPDYATAAQLPRLYSPSRSHTERMTFGHLQPPCVLKRSLLKYAPPKSVAAFYVMVELRLREKLNTMTWVL